MGGAGAGVGGRFWRGEGLRTGSVVVVSVRVSTMVVVNSASDDSTKVGGMSSSGIGERTAILTGGTQFSEFSWSHIVIPPFRFWNKLQAYHLTEPVRGTARKGKVLNPKGGTHASAADIALLVVLFLNV